MDWFQKYSDQRSHSTTPVVIFKVNTLLLGPQSLIPVQMTSIIVEDTSDEVVIIRMDIQELSTAEALALNLPLFDPTIYEDAEVSAMQDDEELVCDGKEECSSSCSMADPSKVRESQVPSDGQVPPFAE